MNRAVSYYLVFFPVKGRAMHKKVEKSMFASLAQNDVIKELQIGEDTVLITSRRPFNVINSITADFFLIIDIIPKTN